MGRSDIEADQTETWPPDIGIAPYFADDAVCIFHGDCRNILPLLPKVDLVLTDPPYGLTENEWDIKIALDDWWKAIKRHSSTTIMTASQPFTSMCVLTNLEQFRHEWVWIKNRGSNFGNTVREPMKEHESVLVFSEGKWTYHPQMQQRTGGGLERVKYPVKSGSPSTNYRQFTERILDCGDLRVPSSWQKFNTEVGWHPTQKPVALFAYLMATYSNLGDTILDPFMGSGTTGIAAKKLGRRAIGIEIELKYCEIAAKRMAQSVMPLKTAGAC